MIHMRSERRFSKRVKTVCTCVIIAIFAYTLGFSHGQASVYEKAKNDHKLFEQLWGNN
jgi:hypothetical protein